MSPRTDPYRNYRFVVEIDALIVGGFSEVTGLERELETEEYREGGVNGYVHQFPSGYTHPNLTLHRGLTNAPELWAWFQSAQYAPVVRKTCRIVLQDATGSEVWGWQVRDAYPVSWSGPELRGAQGEVAIETLELAHRGLSTLGGMP